MAYRLRNGEQLLPHLHMNRFLVRSARRATIKFIVLCKRELVQTTWVWQVLHTSKPPLTTIVASSMAAISSVVICHIRTLADRIESVSTAARLLRREPRLF